MEAAAAVLHESPSRLSLVQMRFSAMAFAALFLAAFAASCCAAAAAEQPLHQWTVLRGGSSDDRAYSLEAGRASTEVLRQMCANDITMMCDDVCIFVLFFILIYFADWIRKVFFPVSV